MANVTDPSSTEHMKESTLEAIGYICQDIVSRRALMETVVTDDAFMMSLCRGSFSRNQSSCRRTPTRS